MHSCSILQYAQSLYYSASCIMQTLHLVQDNGQIYEALKTMAACYLRADTSSICDCLSAFGLNDLLFDLSRYDISRGAPLTLSREYIMRCS